MTEITKEADIKLEVISNGCRRKTKEKKTDKEQLIWKKKKEEKIKTGKKIHAKPVNIEKKIEKKEKRRTRKCFWKKNGKKENEGRYEHIFCFYWLWV